MAKITITIEGETEELGDTLQRLFAAASDSTTSVLPQAGSEPSGQRVEWTSDLVREFWGGLARNAKRILTEIAKEPTGADLSTVRDRLGISRGSLAGSLAPIGFAMNRINRRHGITPSDYPYCSDHSTSTFQMPQNLADMILEISEFNERVGTAAHQSALEAGGVQG